MFDVTVIATSKTRCTNLKRAYQIKNEICTYVGRKEGGGGGGGGEEQKQKGSKNKNKQTNRQYLNRLLPQNCYT